MLIAIGRDERERPVLVLGLEEENLKRLRLGQPIMRDMAEFGRADLGSLVLFWGESAADLERQVAAGADLSGARRVEEGRPS
jgi:hypothetical protein